MARLSRNAGEAEADSEGGGIEAMKLTVIALFGTIDYDESYDDKQARAGYRVLENIRNR
jgi:hypothetical protein